MEQTPLPPLVSDEDLKGPLVLQPKGRPWAEDEYRHQHLSVYEVRATYEADRQRTREVVQAADHLAFIAARYATNGNDADAAVARYHAAKSQLQIEPTKP